MVGIGLLLFLWGMSWQSTTETDPLEDGKLTGGPALIPLGILMIAFGGMWIWMGWHGFPGKEDMNAYRRCPHCNRKVETDLDFCYYCGERFNPPKQGEKGKDQGNDPRKKAPEIDRIRDRR